jgi:uncharacterized protein YdhG (YjbR/CyaY superfamily)
VSAAKKSTAGTKDKSYEGFTAEERVAMKERGKELKAGSRRAGPSKEDGEASVLEKIAEMGDTDRVIAEGIHAIIKATAPELEPKLWYGMPAYAKDGKVLCFFQSSAKFKTRYATFGFNDVAKLDDGSMWPTAYALTKLTAGHEKKIAELVKKSVS